MPQTLKVGFGLAVAIASLTTAAHCTAVSPPLAVSAVDAGPLGLAALAAQNFDRAIALFTAKLNQPNNVIADRELALLCRGKAYVGTSRFAEAADDFNAALKISPSDREAKAGLKVAEAGLRSSGSDNPAGVVAISPAWGALAKLVGHSWIIANDHPFMYTEIRWKRYGTEMKWYSLDASQQTVEYWYTLDPKTGVIKVKMWSEQLTAQGKARLEGNQIVAEISQSTKPWEPSTSLRQRILEDGRGVTILEDRMGAYGWEAAETATMRPSDREAASLMGFIFAPKTPFLKELGAGLLDMTARSFVGAINQRIGPPPQ